MISFSRSLEIPCRQKCFDNLKNTFAEMISDIIRKKKLTEGMGTRETDCLRMSSQHGADIYASTAADSRLHA